MLADEIRAGESDNIEFKVELPKRSEKYMKSVIAFANTAGGKIIIGVCAIRRFFQISVLIRLKKNV